MSKLIWIVDWVLDDGKDTLPEDVAAWRASIYRWVLIALFSVGGVWLAWFLGDYAASRVAQPYEGFATVEWIGDASYTRYTGTAAHKGGASGEFHIRQDGALVHIDGLSEPIMHTAFRGTLTSWLHVGDRVRVKYKRGTFLFFENITVMNLMTLNEPQQSPAL